MGTFNNIDFTSLVTFNGATVPTAPGATELTTWDPAPAGASDGDYYQMSGTSTVYRYDSDFGILVRPEIYDFAGTKTLDAVIRGNETGATLSSRGWSVESASDITTDSTWTTFDSTSNRTGATLSAGTTANGMYFAGFLSHSAGPGSDYYVGNSVTAENGNFSYLFSTKRATTSNDPGFVKVTASFSEIKLEQVDDFDLSATGGKWVEIYVISGSTTDEQAFAWIGHSESPVRFSALLDTTSNTGWNIGTPSWGSTNHNGAITVKNCYFARLS
jgi:hypothetical protein